MNTEIVFSSNLSLTTPFGISEAADSDQDTSGWSWGKLEWHWWIVLQLMSAVIGLVGNLLVILVLHQRRASSRSTDVLVRSLATADFIASCLLIPYPPHRRVPSSRLGGLYCWFVGNNTLMWICFTASTYNLVAISCDRYFAIVHPLQFKRYVTKQRVNVSVCLLWMASFFVTATPIFIHYGVDPRSKTCAFIFESATSKVAYGWFIFFLRLAIPVTVLLLTQTAIAFVLHRESKAFRKAATSTRHSEKSAHRTARDHVIKLMVIVIIVFIICWSPNQIFFLGINIGFISFSYLYTPTNRICVIMVLCNSCLNPIIYIVRHPQFREALKELLTGSGMVKNRGPLFEHKTENRERSNSVKISTIE